MSRHLSSTLIRLVWPMEISKTSVRWFFFQSTTKGTWQNMSVQHNYHTYMKQQCGHQEGQTLNISNVLIVHWICLQHTTRQIKLERSKLCWRWFYRITHDTQGVLRLKFVHQKLHDTMCRLSSQPAVQNQRTLAVLCPSSNSQILYTSHHRCHKQDRPNVLIEECSSTTCLMSIPYGWH
jgi:hypothetical protein